MSQRAYIAWLVIAMDNNVISFYYAEKYVVTLVTYSGLPDPVWTIIRLIKALKQ